MAEMLKARCESCNWPMMLVRVCSGCMKPPGQCKCPASAIPKQAETGGRPS
jgi:nitrate reductase beta subunit